MGQARLCWVDSQPAQTSPTHQNSIDPLDFKGNSFLALVHFLFASHSEDFWVSLTG